MRGVLRALSFVVGGGFSNRMARSSGTDYTYDVVGTGGTASGTSPMPEPSAALMFAIGALVMRGQLRRRRNG